MSDEHIFISESVTAAHPDKLCDQISDEIVDRLLIQDPASRVMAECAMFGGIVFLATRFACDCGLDLGDTARRVLSQAGYRVEDLDAEKITVMSSHLDLDPEHYPGIDVMAMDDDELEQLPAGNQVTVFGFASRQTESLMPLPIVLARTLAARLEQVVRDGTLDYLLPDGKSQVAVVYRERTPVRLHSLSVVCSLREGVKAGSQKVSDDLMQAVVEPVFAEQELKPERSTRIYMNPQGPYVGGGPRAHSGLTGRKTAIDAYGEYARHGGAALSGKDPLCIDRVGAYGARYVAKHVVAAGLARDCEVQLSYTVGSAAPISIQVDTFNTGTKPDREIENLIRTHFRLTPAGIARDLDLQRIAGATESGFYRRLATYGHMGRVDMVAPWERLDRLDAMKG